MSVLAKEINKLYDSSQELLQAGFKQALKAGEMLAEAQDLAGSENFAEWLSENCSFDLSTAEKFIKLFNGKKVFVSACTQKEVEQET